MTSRRVLACAAACFALFAAAWGSEAAADTRDEAAIVQALQRWTEDFNARRADRVCDLFAPDLVADYRGQPTKTFDSLCPALQRDLSQSERSYAYRLEIHDVVVSGDMAAVRLTWYLTVTDAQTGETFASRDRGLDVFRRQPDGSWRIVRYLAYEETD